MVRLHALLILCSTLIFSAPLNAAEKDPRIDRMLMLIQARAPDAPAVTICTTNTLNPDGTCASSISVIFTHGTPTMVLKHPGYVFDSNNEPHPVTIIFRDVGITGTLTSATVLHYGPIVRDPLFPALRQELYELALDGALDFMLEELTKR